MDDYLSVTDARELTPAGIAVVGKAFLPRSEYEPPAEVQPKPAQPATAPKFAGYSYGDSWTGAKVGYSASSYPPLLRDLMGLASISNRGVAGSRIQNVAVHAQSPGGAPWTIGTSGIVTVGALLNNQVEGDNTENRDTAYESMRAIVARLSANAVKEDSDTSVFTFNGAWSVFTNTTASGGGARYVNPTLAADATHTDTVTVNVPAGTNYIQLIGLDTAVGVGATFTLHNASDVELVRTRTDGRSKATPGQGAGQGAYAPVVMRVPGTSGGVFTLKVTTPPGYAGTVLGYVDCLITLSTTPPLVALLKPVHVTHPSYQKVALETYLRTIPDTIASEFSNVVVSDPNLGFDNVAMLGPDLLHPIDSGQAHVTEAILEAVNVSAVRRALIQSVPGLIS